MRPYVSQCTLRCPHMARLSWLTPPAQSTGSFTSTAVPKKPFRYRQPSSWPTYSWHLQQPLFWQWFTAHTVKMYILPDAAVELCNNTTKTSVMKYVMLSRWISQTACTTFRLIVCSKQNQIRCLCKLMQDMMLQVNASLLTKTWSLFVLCHPCRWNWQVLVKAAATVKFLCTKYKLKFCKK